MTKPIVRVLIYRRRRFDAEMFQRTHRSMIIRGKWSYLYRAVDKHGKTVDFLLRPDRGIAAAQAFFAKLCREFTEMAAQDHARWPLAEPYGPSASAARAAEVEVC
jgi:transposase-like protein